MASTTLLVDDLTGDTIEEGKGGTYTFGLLNDEDEEFVKYEIDLTTPNAAKLKEALAPFIEHARPLTTRRTRSTEAEQVRAWAKQNGYDISERGRIPQEVQDAYEAAHRAPEKGGNGKSRSRR